MRKRTNRARRGQAERAAMRPVRYRFGMPRSHSRVGPRESTVSGDRAGYSPITRGRTSGSRAPTWTGTASSRLRVLSPTASPTSCSSEVEWLRLDGALQNSGRIRHRDAGGAGIRRSWGCHVCDSPEFCSGEGRALCTRAEPHAATCSSAPAADDAALCRTQAESGTATPGAPESGGSWERHECDSPEFCSGEGRADAARAEPHAARV